MEDRTHWTNSTAKNAQPDQVAGAPQDAAGQVLVVVRVGQPRYRAVVQVGYQSWPISSVWPMIVTPRNAWNGRVSATIIIRAG